MMKTNLWRDSHKEITNQTDQYLVILSSKTNGFEDKLTKYESVCLIISFSVPIHQDGNSEVRGG